MLPSNLTHRLTGVNHMIGRADSRDDVGRYGLTDHGKANLMAQRSTWPRDPRAYVRESAIHSTRHPQVLLARPREPRERQQALATCPFVRPGQRRTN